MALPALLVGGIVGSLSFLISLLALDHSVLGAFGVYMAAGLASSMMILGWVWAPVRARAADIKAA